MYNASCQCCMYGTEHAQLIIYKPSSTCITLSLCLSLIKIALSPHLINSRLVLIPCVQFTAAQIRNPVARRGINIICRHLDCDDRLSNQSNNLAVCSEDFISQPSHNLRWFQVNALVINLSAEAGRSLISPTHCNSANAVLSNLLLPTRGSRSFQICSKLVFGMASGIVGKHRGMKY